MWNFTRRKKFQRQIMLNHVELSDEVQKSSKVIALRQYKQNDKEWLLV